MLKPWTPAVCAAVLATTFVAALIQSRPVTCPEGTAPIRSAVAQAAGRHCTLPLPREREEGSYTLRPLRRGPLPSPTLMEAAIESKEALQARQKHMLNATANWSEYGKGGLLTGTSIYSARVDNFAYDPIKKRLFAAIGTGGIWMSTAVNGDVRTLADQWVSVGDKLPSQINGGVIWSPDVDGDGDADPSSEGTLLAAGGESVMGNNGYMGFGAYWSRDLGATWTRSSGFPSGVQVYNAKADPQYPNIFYIASSIGLYRSIDAGRSFVNVALPSSPECAGKEDISSACQFANVVTDVAIRAPGGNPARSCSADGCPVVAAIGWRAGQATFPDGKVMGVGNGLYRSDSGKPGSFTRVDNEPINAASPQGFAPKTRSARIEFGTTDGPAQDHNYLYALVQDAVHFNTGYSFAEPILDDPASVDSSNVNGLYVSADFGLTWTRMADDNEIVTIPGSINFPGAQAWYNQWVAIDPTRADPATGIPLRMTFALEEVFQNITTPLNGPAQAASPQDFELIGRYSEVGTTTTHPDQHVGLYVADGAGGVCLFVGNDGGVNRQCVAAGVPMTNACWGNGHNEGVYALLPYGLAVAKDGTVWQGHQDNGSGHIEPDTREQIMDFGADGFFAEVDPDNSDISYTESQNGGLRRTLDRGASSTNIAPPYTRVNFINWFVMDPLDAKHMLTGARQIFATLNAPAVTRTTWTTVFDLGVNPVTNVNRTTTTMHVYGDAAYVGFCGDCGSVATDTGFVNGIATNVNGDKPPKKGTADGWHIAKAQGLDSRLVLGMEMDEAQPATVYVTLAGYTGNMRPPGSYLDPNAAKIGTGVVFKSTDAGETFTDISGDLPRIQTNTILLHKNPDGTEQLIVGTDLGPFISSDNQGSSWAPLGKGLPNVPVAMLRFKPKATAVEQTTVFAATFGRGIWTYPIAEAAVGGSSSSSSGGSSSGGGSGGSSSGATTSSSSGASPLDPAPQTDPSSTHQGKPNTGRFGGGSFGFALLAALAPLALRRRRGLLSV